MREMIPGGKINSLCIKYLQTAIVMNKIAAHWNLNQLYSHQNRKFRPFEDP